MSVDPVGGTEKSGTGYDIARQAARGDVPEQKSNHSSAAISQDPVSVSLHRMASTMGKLENVNLEKNQFATKIRETNKALQNMSPLVNGMKESLTTIVKNWPPFPVDSQERKDLLMSYSALRKEIISMTLPAPPTPVYESNARLWDKLGLSTAESPLPELTAHSSDSEIGTALAEVSSFGETLTAGQNDLVKAVSQ